MTVIEIRGDSDFQTHMRDAGGKLVVVDFSATWCGPCQFIKPTFENYSRQYHDVIFLGVDEAQNRSLIGSLGVRGFPTFHFYVNQRKVDELVGADPNQLRNKIEQWRQSVFNPFASPGVTLGSYGTASLDPREARLRRFNESSNTTTTPAPAPAVPKPAVKSTPKASEENMVCDPVTGTCHLEPSTSSGAIEDDTSLPDVNEEFLKQLMEMGFAEIRSTKALLATENSTLEAAIVWLGEHQEDPEIDEPIQFVDLSKQMKKKPLTEEEKQKKIAELQAKMEQRRQEREEKEKQNQIENELKRRTMGQEIQAAKEEYEAIQRKLVADQLKKEREEAKKEKERLRKLIEQDKLIRKAHGGKLVGPPVEILSEENTLPNTTTNNNTTTNATSTLNPQEQIVDCISKLRQYRVGDDGLTALKTLMVYVKNILEKPKEEEKYRTINLENAAFRKRVGSLVGGIAFLKALGFEKDEQDGNLKMALEDRNEKLLTFAKNKLDYAIAEMTH